MVVKATTRNVRQNPRKVSVAAALIRGRSVSDALTILEHTPRHSARAIEKTLISAKANAEHNHNFRPDSLFISEISVTAGSRYKRYRKHGRGHQGRFNLFQRKSSNIQVVVDGEKRQTKRTSQQPQKENR